MIQLPRTSSGAPFSGDCCAWDGHTKSRMIVSKERARRIRSSLCQEIPDPDYSQECRVPQTFATFECVGVIEPSQLPLAFVGRWPVDRRHLLAVQPEINRQLSAMVR